MLKKNSCERELAYEILKYTHNCLIQSGILIHEQIDQLEESNRKSRS